MQQAAKEIGSHALSVRTDVTDEGSVAAAFREAVIAFGGLDTMVLSAGVAAASPIEETSFAEWQRLHAILAAGYFLTAREAFRILKKQGYGGSLIQRGRRRPGRVPPVRGASHVLASTLKSTRNRGVGPP